MEPVITVIQLEINIVDHCNLSCKGCNHGSPITPVNYVSLESVKRDLDGIKPFIRAQKIRLIGGEPTLHPQIDDLLQICKDAQIANSVEINTNGTKLDKMSERFWQILDFAFISAYPGIEQNYPQQYKHKVLANKSNYFKYPFSSNPNTDIDLVNNIWSQCQIRDYVYGVIEGYLFRCFRSSSIARLLKFEDPNVDALKIADLTAETLKAYSERVTPLKGCGNCTGSCGVRYDHTQVMRKNWHYDLNRPFEEILDRSLLK